LLVVRCRASSAPAGDGTWGMVQASLNSGL
jgi:hypothetical protein